MVHVYDVHSSRALMVAILSKPPQCLGLYAVLSPETVVISLSASIHSRRLQRDLYWCGSAILSARGP